MEDLTGPRIVTVDRRVTLQWLVGAMAASQLAACGDKVGDTSWPEVAMVKAKGIGTDPDLLDPVVPWPLTLSRAELRTVAALSDLILPASEGAPAPSEVGVPAFIDEWVSAPYPDQHRDRALIIPGLAWLDEQSTSRNGAAFWQAKPDGQKAILDEIAYKDRVKPGFEKLAEFFGRTRALTLGAFYTTREGWKDIGYLGNTTGTGAYPGPPPEAVEHMRGVVEAMGLKLDTRF
jgi:hypothetical protein